MAAKVFLENELARIWVDEFAPLMFTHVRRFPSTKDEFNSVKSIKIKCIKTLFAKHNTVYSIFDASEAQSLNELAIEGYCQHCLVAQFHHGLKYKAFLRPKPLSAAITLSEALNILPFEATDIFGSFEDSLSYINGLWNNHLGNQFRQYG